MVLPLVRRSRQTLLQLSEDADKHVPLLLVGTKLLRTTFVVPAQELVQEHRVAKRQMNRNPHPPAL